MPTAPPYGPPPNAPDQYWQTFALSIDHIITHRLNELISWHVTSMGAQNTRLDELNAVVAALAASDKQAAAHRERVVPALGALFEHGKAADRKLDVLARTVGVGPQDEDGGPSRSLLGRVKDIEFTMGELLERVGDPLASAGPPAGPQPVVRHEVATSPMRAPPRTPSPPPRLGIRHEMGTSPIRFPSGGASQAQAAPRARSDLHTEGEDMQTGHAARDDAQHAACADGRRAAREDGRRPAAEAHEQPSAPRRTALAPHPSMPSPTPSARAPSATPFAVYARPVSGAGAVGGDVAPGTLEPNPRLPTPATTVRCSSVVDETCDASPGDGPSWRPRPLARRTEEDAEAVTAYLLARSSPAEVDGCAGAASSSTPHAASSSTTQPGWTGGTARPIDAGEHSESELSSLSSVSDDEDAHPPDATRSAAPTSSRAEASTSSRAEASTSARAEASQSESRQVTRARVGRASVQPQAGARSAAQAQGGARSSLQPKSKGQSAAKTRVKRRRDHGDDSTGAPAKRARSEASINISGPARIQQIKQEEGDMSSLKGSKEGAAGGGRRGRSGSVKRQGESAKADKKRGRRRKKAAVQWPARLDGSTYWTTECDSHYKDTVANVQDSMCMRPDCPHQINVDANYLGDYEIDYLVGRFTKITSQTGKQEWYLVKWAPPWTIKDCTWQIPGDFEQKFITKFVKDAAAEGQGGQHLVLLKEAEEGLRANPEVDWNKFEPIGSVLHTLDES
ncbi:hypothetical protein HDZ31DRAFT_73495 [Schizophyllum fasciatum]